MFPLLLPLLTIKLFTEVTYWYTVGFKVSLQATRLLISEDCQVKWATGIQVSIMCRGKINTC